MTTFSNRVATWAEATIGDSLAHPERFASLEALEGRVMELVAVEQFARGRGRALSCPRAVVASYSDFLRRRYAGTRVRSVLEFSDDALGPSAAESLVRHVFRHARSVERRRKNSSVSVEIVYDAEAFPSSDALDRSLARLRTALASLVLDGTPYGSARSQVVEALDWELVDVAIPLPLERGGRIGLFFDLPQRATWLAESVVRVALGHLSVFFAGDVESQVVVDPLVGVQALRLIPDGTVRLLRVAGRLLRGYPPVDVFASLKERYRARLEASLSGERFRATSRVVTCDPVRSLLVLSGEPEVAVFLCEYQDTPSVGADVRVMGTRFTAESGRSFVLGERLQVL